MKFFTQYIQSVGGTPLIKINKLSNSGAGIFAKMESRNPSGSVKCRIAVNMINTAIKNGSLMPNMTIVEPTSGNTGVGLAFVAASLGYSIVLTMPESMSIERRNLMRAYGAKLILTDAASGMKGAIAKATELAQQNNYFMPSQFDNPANPEIHMQTTGPEIWQDTEGKVDVFVAGVGTGGTITGVSRFLKSKKNILSVAVEPAESPVITQTLNKEEIKPSSHKIQGIGAGFVPANLDLTVVDKVCVVSSEQARMCALELAKKEGILCGISGGAAMYIALELAKSPDMNGKNIVAIIPDNGERYLSSYLFEEMLVQ